MAPLEALSLSWPGSEQSSPRVFFGLGIRVARMGFAAQATYWSAVDLHKVVMSSICVALNRPLQETHPEETTALAADEYASVMVENDASKVYEASPWAADEQSYNRGSCLRRMDSAARMLSEDGGSSWSKCC